MLFLCVCFLIFVVVVASFVFIFLERKKMKLSGRGSEKNLGEIGEGRTSSNKLYEKVFNKKFKIKTHS